MWIGLELTLYGMSLVFLLLGALWGLISLMIRLDMPRTRPEPALGSAAPAEIPALGDDELAAVVIACRAHRMLRRKQAAPEMRTHQPGSLPSRWVSVGRTRQNRSWAPGGRFS